MLIVGASPENRGVLSSFSSKTDSAFNRIVIEEVPVISPPTASSSSFTWKKNSTMSPPPVHNLIRDTDMIVQPAINGIRANCAKQLKGTKDKRSLFQYDLFQWALRVDDPYWQLKEEGETSSNSPSAVAPMPSKSSDLTANQAFGFAKLLQTKWNNSWENTFYMLKEDQAKAYFADRIMRVAPQFLINDGTEIDVDRFEAYEAAQKKLLDAIKPYFDRVFELHNALKKPLPSWPEQIKMATTLASFDFWKNQIQAADSNLDEKMIYRSILGDMEKLMRHNEIIDADSFNEMFMASLYVRLNTKLGNQHVLSMISSLMREYHQSTEYAIRELFPFPENPIFMYLDRRFAEENLVAPKHPAQYLLENYLQEKFDEPRILPKKEKEASEDIVRARSFAIDGVKVESNNFTKFKSYIDKQDNLPSSVKQAAFTQLSQNGCIWAGGVDFLLHMSDKKNSQVMAAMGETAGYMAVPTNEGLISSLNVSVSLDGKLFVDCSYTPKEIFLASSSPGSKHVSLENPVSLDYRLEISENAQGEACVTVQVKDWDHVAKFLGSVAAVSREFEKEHPELRSQTPIALPKPPAPTVT